MELAHRRPLSAAVENQGLSVETDLCDGQAPGVLQEVAWRALH
jgi:hypothetical protein